MRVEVKKLKDLKHGDYFFSMSDRNRKTRYMVVGNAEFNLRAGSATRRCLNTATGYYEDKLCRKDVVFVTPNSIDIVS